VLDYHVEMNHLNRTVHLLLFTQFCGAWLFGQELVLANGHQLFLDCQGAGPGPAVILLAGGGGTTNTWDKVQPAVAAFARVCSYDRAGLGKSSPVRKAQSADQIVDDLADLLANAHVPAPYVLAGHSIGGLYARRFDERYDSKVAGMVLVDSSHEEQIWRFAQDEPAALAEYPNWKDNAAMEEEGFWASHERLEWHFAKPLIVLEHGIPDEPVWHAMQEDLASRSPKGKLIMAAKSSHYIQRLQPDLVIESIRTVLSQSR
jgi:pimeloyl-ACP methyl ester carboxylesterase